MARRRCVSLPRVGPDVEISVDSEDWGQALDFESPEEAQLWLARQLCLTPPIMLPKAKRRAPAPGSKRRLQQEPSCGSPWIPIAPATPRQTPRRPSSEKKRPASASSGTCRSSAPPRPADQWWEPKVPTSGLLGPLADFSEGLMRQVQVMLGFYHPHLGRLRSLVEQQVEKLGEGFLNALLVKEAFFGMRLAVHTNELIQSLAKRQRLLSACRAKLEESRTFLQEQVELRIADQAAAAAELDQCKQDGQRELRGETELRCAAEKALVAAAERRKLVLSAAANLLTRRCGKELLRRAFSSWCAARGDLERRSRLAELLRKCRSRSEAALVLEKCFHGWRLVAAQAAWSRSASAAVGQVASAADHWTTRALCALGRRSRQFNELKLWQKCFHAWANQHMLGRLKQLQERATSAGSASRAAAETRRRLAEAFARATAAGGFSRACRLVEAAFLRWALEASRSHSGARLRAARYDAAAFQVKLLRRHGLTTLLRSSLLGWHLLTASGLGTLTWPAPVPASVEDDGDTGGSGAVTPPPAPVGTCSRAKVVEALVKTGAAPQRPSSASGKAAAKPVGPSRAPVQSLFSRPVLRGGDTGGSSASTSLPAGPPSAASQPPAAAVSPNLAGPTRAAAGRLPPPFVAPAALADESSSTAVPSAPPPQDRPPPAASSTQVEAVSTRRETVAIRADALSTNLLPAEPGASDTIGQLIACCREVATLEAVKHFDLANKALCTEEGYNALVDYHRQRSREAQSWTAKFEMLAPSLR